MKAVLAATFLLEVADEEDATSFHMFMDDHFRNENEKIAERHGMTVEERDSVLKYLGMTLQVLP